MSVTSTFRPPNFGADVYTYDFFHKIVDLKSAGVIIVEQKINAWI